MLCVNYGRLLGLFERVRPSCRKQMSWVARCPAHEDRSPSLSITVGRNGSLLLHCHAGCNLMEILQAVGLRVRDLYPDDGRPMSANWIDAPRRKVVETYDYRDEKGTLLYQVLRFEPKSFAQRRPDPCNPKGWLWGLGAQGDTRRILFRLPEILAAPDRAVFVVEGERKVLTLERMGFLATCNAGGTGMGWCDGYSRSLQGRQVVVLPDNDGAGIEHAYTVVGSLLVHGAQNVRLVQLPGLKHKEDIVDWQGCGGTREQLMQIVASTPCWAPREKALAAR